MQGSKKGFVIFVRLENPNVLVVHCMIHWEALASNLNRFSLCQLYDVMDAAYKYLLYHTDVRWLSWRYVLMRIVHLKTEIISFLAGKQRDFGFMTKTGGQKLHFSPIYFTNKIH